MKFTAQEMTVAIHRYAKIMVEEVLLDAGVASPGNVTEQAEPTWADLDSGERFRLIRTLSELALPFFANLPEVDVPAGSHPTFTEEQVREALAAPVREYFMRQLGYGTKFSNPAADRGFDGVWALHSEHAIDAQIPTMMGILDCLPVRTDDAEPVFAESLTADEVAAATARLLGIPVLDDISGI